MECPPTCSAWCEAVPSIDGIGLLKTSDSISSESCACQGTMELQESDSEEKSSSQDGYTDGVCGESFNRVKKRPGWPTAVKQLITIEPPPEFQDSPPSPVGHDIGLLVFQQTQHSPESISVDDCAIHLLIPWMEKFASRLVAALIEEALSVSCKVTWSIQCSQDCHPADSQQMHQQEEQHTTVSRSMGRWSGPRLCWTPELPPFSSPYNRPGSRSSLASSRLSGSHNSLSVPSANKVDDSSFITSAMSHDVLTSGEISDMYNVPFDSDIYAVPIDVVRPPRTPQRPKRQQRHHHRKRRRHASTDFQSEQDHSTRQHLNLRVKTVTASQIHAVKLPSHADVVSESGGVKRHSVPGTSAARQARSASTECPSAVPGEPVHMTLHEVRQYLQNLYSSSSDSSDNKNKMDFATPKHQNKTVHNGSNNNRNNNRSIVEDMDISSKSVNGNIVANSVRKNKKNTFVINIKNKKTKDACDVMATKDKDDSVRSELPEDKEKVKKPPTGRHSFSTNLKQTLCSIFRIRKLPSPDDIATGEKSEIAGCCVGNGTISTSDSADVGGKAPFLTRALPPLPSTVMLPDCDQDATSLPSPEDRPMTAEEEEEEEEEEFGEEPSMDFASSIEKVKDYGWYWGPISGEAAEKILSNEPDGSFIVRDSSDDHYIFSLTFKLNGCIRHVRIEHDQGNFSFGSCTKFKSHTIVDFIENAVEHSRSGRYLFFLHRRPVLGPMRVQLLHPVSRFKQVQSLQHMCRFVILKLVRRDLIPALPLPRRVIDYLSTPHYYSEQLVVEDDLAPSPEDVDMLSFVPQGLS